MLYSVPQSITATIESAGTTWVERGYTCPWLRTFDRYLEHVGKTLTHLLAQIRGNDGADVRAC